MVIRRRNFCFRKACTEIWYICFPD